MELAFYKFTSAFFISFILGVAIMQTLRKPPKENIPLQKNKPTIYTEIPKPKLSNSLFMKKELAFY